jgi:hypothetical protein
MKWYNVDETLSHNCLFNFVIGSRGVGKTYSYKDRAIRNFLKNKAQFIYVRRYKEELKTLSNFFNAVKPKYTDLEFKTDGMKLYINDELAGHAIALSTSESIKSTDFPDVTLIIFDEFLIETGVHRYLPKEVQKFLGLYETVARMRDVTALFFANATTMTNPYFLYFNIKIPHGSSFYKQGDILFQYIDNHEYTDAKNKTRFGQIIAGTEYGGFSVDNKFLLDSTSFIEKKNGKADFLFSMVYNSYRLGVWVSYQDGKMWVSYDAPTGRLEYAITLADHTENTLLIKALGQSRFFKSFLENYKIGRVFFEDINIKNITYEVIKLTLR